MTPQPAFLPQDDPTESLSSEQMIQIFNKLHDGPFSKAKGRFFHEIFRVNFELSTKVLWRNERTRPVGIRARRSPSGPLDDELLPRCNDHQSFLK